MCDFDLLRMYRKGKVKQESKHLLKETLSNTQLVCDTKRGGTAFASLGATEAEMNHMRGGTQ